MPQSVEDRIRELAYLKWEKAGYPGGDGVNFWLEAEEEVNNGQSKKTTKLPSPATPTAKAAHKSPTKK